MNNNDERDYEEERYWARFCPECGTSPCESPDGHASDDDDLPDGWRSWASPAGIIHVVPPEGPCATCGAGRHDELPPWRPASCGEGKHRWFLIRGRGAESLRVPLADRYHLSAHGRLVRYFSGQTAQAAAGRLNRQEANRAYVENLLAERDPELAATLTALVTLTCALPCGPGCRAAGVPASQEIHVEGG